jgi:hypothetical protein
MPLARYFLWVGSVLLALFLIADACLPRLPDSKATTDARPRVVHVYSEQKWPERIVFDTSAPMPRVATAANSVEVNPAQQSATAIPDRAREALAQLQTSDVVPGTIGGPKKQEARMQRQQKVARRHVTRPPFRRGWQPQYAWFGGRMWW